MHIKSEKTLVTFGVIAYKQEKYIREAIEGAFAQTYSPLQIILSDDASSDKTFEIMQEMTRQYNGPHQIILNKNEHNTGLADHINKVMELSNGELIVIAAGDDISNPERTSEIVDFYENQGKPDSIFSSFTQINESSKVIDFEFNDTPYEQDINEFIRSPQIKGAAHAWSKRIFEKFGPLSSDVLCEDQVIPFRAYLLNKPRFLDKKLIKYRRTNSNVTKAKFFDTHLRRKLSSTRQYMRDIEKYPTRKDIAEVIQKEYEKNLLIYEFWTSTAKIKTVNFFKLIKLIGFKKALYWATRNFMVSKIIDRQS